MRLHQLFFVAISALFATLAHASSIPAGGSFEVGLNDPDQTGCMDSSGCGGWFEQDGAPSSFTDAVNTVNPSDNYEFSQGTFICDDAYDCYDDPKIQIKPGGDAPFPGPFSADASGGGIFDFTNDTTSPFSSITFFTPLNPNVTYSCSSPIYNFCGFQAIDYDTVLEIVFDNAATSAVPEPSEYLFFLVAGAAIAVAHRLRSRRKSA